MFSFNHIRANIFYFGFGLLTIWFSLSGLLLILMPYKIRAGYMVLWNKAVIAWLTLTCGVKYNVKGTENLPQQPYVALAKHQSEWETFFLQQFLFPVCLVLKKELLSAPFFGWGLRLFDPIAIDRGSPKKAIRQTMSQGLARLDRNISVLIFPEGTRVAPGEKGKYARGGANLALDGNVPIVPIAHNACYFWPSKAFTKHAGTIEVVIGKPIAPNGRSSRELTEEVETWIEEQMAKLPTSADLA